MSSAVNKSAENATTSSTRKLGLFPHTWLRLKALLGGPLRYGALALPLVGYLALFNDTVTNSLTFSNLTEQAGDPLGGPFRLKLVYFGILLFSIAGILYNARCPEAVKRFGNGEDFCFSYLKGRPAREIVTFKRTPYEKIRSFAKLQSLDVARISTVIHNYRTGETLGDEQDYDLVLLLLRRRWEYINIVENRFSKWTCSGIVLLGLIFLSIPSLLLSFDVFASLIPIRGAAAG